ncbi:MAG: cyclic nucleotide-binding domain-containing protein [Deltaproteobacteria bacterium]|nr:MAG: cyclic nucleotide-binding domain-containing protein [Deltaproteobacteria bacterium]
MSDDADRLSSLRPLRGLSASDVRSFVDACIRLAVPAGTPLIHEGDRDCAMIFVLDGSLEVFRGPGGGRPPLRQTGPGGQLGELALLGLVRRRTASVRATTDADLLVLDDAGLARLRAQGHPVADRIEAEALRALARSLREVDARIARLARGDADLPTRAAGWARLHEALATARGGRVPPRDAPSVLARSAHFRRVPDPQRRRLARHLEPRPFAAGQAIVCEGDIGGDAWLIATGEVGAWRRTGDHHHERLASLFPGTIFGQVAVIDGDVRTATCAGEAPGWLYRIPRELCQEELDRGSPEGRALRQGLLDALTRQLQLGNDHLTLLQMEHAHRTAAAPWPN